MRSSFKYKAFISYSHQDKKWGDWLHKALETYRVPRGLAGKETAYGAVPARLFPVFRDREELPTATELGGLINKALEQSSHLIVICSPRSAKSQWVNEEILQFKRLGKADRILCLIVDGEPNASDKFAPELEQEECFPEAVKYELDEDGDLSEHRTEPIAADARPGKDGKQNSLMKLVAGLLGIGFDELKQRDNLRRTKRRVALAGVSAVLIAVVGALTTWGIQQRSETIAQKAETSRQKAETNRQKSEANKQKAEAAKQREIAAEKQRVQRLSAYSSSMLLVQQDWEDANLGKLRERLDQYRSDDDLKGFEWYYWNRLAKSDLITFREHSGGVRCVSFSPDGKQIVSVGQGANDRGKIIVWNVKTGQQTRVIEVSEGGSRVAVNCVSFSPDGKWIGSGGDGGIVGWMVTGGQEMFTHRGGKVQSVSFSPDEKRIASGSIDGTVKIWDVGPDQKPHTLQGHSRTVNSVRFSPDGQRIVSGSQDKTLRVWDANRQKTSTLKGHVFPVLCASFSPDGKWIVSGSQDKTLKVWDANSGQNVRTMRHSSSVTSVSFSPDGKRIVSGSVDKTAKVWDAQTGRETLTLQGHSEAVRSVSFSPDGTRIISGSRDKTVKVWNAQTGLLMATLDRHSGPVWSVSFSPDGKRIVSGSSDKTVKIRDISSLATYK